MVQVAQDADRETVKAAWRAKSLATHPDKVGAHAEGANEAVSAVKDVRPPDEMQVASAQTLRHRTSRAHGHREPGRLAALSGTCAGRGASCLLPQMGLGIQAPQPLLLSLPCINASARASPLLTVIRARARLPQMCTATRNAATALLTCTRSRFAANSHT